MQTTEIGTRHGAPGRDDLASIPDALAHYRLAGPLLERSFAGIPIVYADFPGGFQAKPHYRTLDVGLTATKLLWCVHRFYAIEFLSWVPLPNDPDRLRFARLLLEQPQPHRADLWPHVREAAQIVRTILKKHGMDAIALAEGVEGIALWIPLADAPHAAAVRTWLHAIAAEAVAAAPTLLATSPNTHDPDRIHLHVASNARGHVSALPYSLRGDPRLPVCLPLAWDEVVDAPCCAATARDFPQWLQHRSDLFAHLLEPLMRQTLPKGVNQQIAVDGDVSPGHTPQPHGHIIEAAIEILGDGKARSAEELCAEAIARGLVPKTTKKKYFYSALIEYIARSLGHGRKPPLVQDAARNFRINEPPDDWPDLVPLPAAAPDPQARALCDRLEATASGDDPAAFEIAVCDAFAHLGFLTRHLGGHGEPDGIADAILGPLSYRAVLECKTAKKIVTQPDAAEAAREAAAANGDRAVLVGPAFSDELELLSELQRHRVTALSVPDLKTLLHLNATALEVQAVLQPGYACDVLGDAVWERSHGRAKRIATLAALIQRAGWEAQRTAAEQDAGARAPHLTVDAAMLLADEALRAAGSATACTREDVDAAFAHLCDPLVGTAVRTDESVGITQSPTT